MTEETESITTRDVACETMVGDLRDLILELFKTREKTWTDMKQHEQESLVDGAVHQIKDAVERAVDLIAADGRKVIKGKLEQITVKDGYKAVVKTSSHDPLRHELIDSQGKVVLLVVSDADAYDIERSPVETDPDEPELPMDEEDGEVYDDDYGANGEDTPVDDEGYEDQEEAA